MTGELYDWNVHSRDGRRAGPGGVSSDRRQAIADLTDALGEAQPGSWGVVWSVRLDLTRTFEYHCDGLVAVGLCDQRSGAVTVDGPPPASPAGNLAEHQAPNRPGDRPRVR
ncbi:hypothetical protein [Actinomadura verrucosospora]|nr:hypothetical protein [Actinomadura verrucosospora]